MTPDLLDLARAAVQSPHWRWLPGMRWHVLRAPPLDDIAGYLVHPLPPGSHPYPGALPDLHDPATVGCLLALVREAFDDDTIHLSPATYDRHDTAEPEIRWHVCRHHEGEDEWMRESGAFGAMVDGHRDPPIVGVSEPAALVAALLAAPPVTPRQ